MLKVLLESRAAKPRRLAGTVASAVVHGALMALAVGLTLPGSGEARVERRPDPTVVYVQIPERPRTTHPRRVETVAPRHAVTIDERPPTVTVPIDIPTHLPPIDVGPSIPPDEIRIGSGGSRLGTGASGLVTAPLGTGDVIESSVADRPPRVVGKPAEPRYPAVLRETGTAGRAVVQFVVDTLGRAEMEGVQVVEATHPLFAESVRAVLARYRFTPGEAAGRKVRTRVQIPFDFTLSR